jgi:16S rRNA (cytidine1402-2'-O)-methyltransferase
MAGTLFVVATPIGNLEDISARALRILREVSLIAAEDTRHTGHLLQRFGLGTRTASFHEHSEKGKAAELVERLKQGDSVALVSDAGTPTISDPGVDLVRLAREAGIRVEPIPGASAAITALSASGIAASEGYVFLGFPPSKGRDRRAWFDRMEAAPGVAPVVVFYEAPHRLQATLAELRRRLGNVNVVLGRELTKLHEEFTVGTLDDLSGHQPRGEYTVVVEIGHLTGVDPGYATVSPAKLAAEFGEATNISGLTRRQAISSLSRKYGLQARAVYAMLEEAKNSPV